jgi:hypothetical protein
MVEDIIRAGVRPDIALIDNAIVARLVANLLDSGDRSFHETCITTDSTGHSMRDVR